MATEAQVKLYLAHWFQLGKRVLLRNGEEAMLPKPIFQNDRYSSEFEACWQRILDAKSGDCYLEGTDQTIAQLLSPAWEIIDCARCQMPVPMNSGGNVCPGCPCADLPLWPNLELPLPHSPVNTRKYLDHLCHRLQHDDIFRIIKRVDPKDHSDDGEFHNSRNHRRV